MNSDLLTLDEESIDLDTIGTENIISFEKNKLKHKNQLINSLKDDYIISLKENYNADDNLFTIMDELLEESNDHEKLIKILDTL